MVPMVEHTAQVSRVQAEVLDCRNFATNIQMAVLPKVRSALCTASQLHEEGPTDVEDAPAPAL